VVVSQEDRSLAVDSQTKSLASKLFSAPASNNNIDYKDKGTLFGYLVLLLINSFCITKRSVRKEKVYYSKY